jgi:hypothetical protein
MQYLLLIYENEALMGDRSPEKNGAIFAGYKKFTQDIIASGAYKAGEALQPTGTATSVRVRDGQRLVTDGPFAETREQLGGFYMVEAADLDAAIAIAAQIPTAQDGTIEVRPIMVWDTPES